MTPVHCTVKHEPEKGTYGDCVRACVASVLNMDSIDVPHFFEDNCSGETGTERIRKFLALMKLAPFFASFDGSYGLSDILEVQRMQNPGVHYILFGATDGGDHVVVCHNGRVVHNPAWYPTPLVGPGSHGHWTIMVIARA